MSERDPTVMLHQILVQEVYDCLLPWIRDNSERLEIAAAIAIEVLQKLADDNIAVVRR